MRESQWEEGGFKSACQLRFTDSFTPTHQGGPGCGADPHCSKYMLDRVMLREYSACAGLQSHHVEETVIPCSLVGRVRGADNKDTDIYEVRVSSVVVRVK